MRVPVAPSLPAASAASLTAIRKGQPNSEWQLCTRMGRERVLRSRPKARESFHTDQASKLILGFINSLKRAMKLELL